MITWWMLPLTGVTTIINRLWRGEGNVVRWEWYGSMTTLFCVAPAPADIVGAACWLLFLIGYAMLPWQAMYSIATGRPPARRDHPAFNWMQTAAAFITGVAVGRPPNPIDPKWWKLFGFIYGVIRGAWMIPGAVALGLHFQSYVVAIVGTGIALGFPLALRLGCAARDHWGMPEDKAVLFEQLIMGWVLGTYMLICHGA